MDGHYREQIFADKFDCRFPCDDLSVAAALISEARTTSVNATVCVLYELVQPPASQARSLTVDRGRKLLLLWPDGFDHPLADLLMMLANRVLAGERLPLDQILFAMDETAHFDGPYARWPHCPVFAYADDDDDLSALDARYEKIRGGCDAEPSP